MKALILCHLKPARDRFPIVHSSIRKTAHVNPLSLEPPQIGFPIVHFRTYSVKDFLDWQCVILKDCANWIRCHQNLEDRFVRLLGCQVWTSSAVREIKLEFWRTRRERAACKHSVDGNDDWWSVPGINDGGGDGWQKGLVCLYWWLRWAITRWW